MFLLVLSLWGPGRHLPSWLLESLGEADEDLIYGLLHLTAENMTLNQPTGARGDWTVPHGTGEGEATFLRSVHLASGEENDLVNPVLSHPGPCGGLSQHHAVVTTPGH